MTPLISHFVSGRPFFSGAALILIAIGISMRRGGRLMPRASISIIAGICGTIFVALSATPLPAWFYVIWSIAVVAGLIVHRRWILPVVAAFTTCLAIVWQLPYYMPPRMSARSDDSFYLIGDSVSAGLGNRDIIRWPQLIQQRDPVSVVDLSRPGATAQSSLKRATAVAADNHLVFLEIGGNDVLGSTPLPEFEDSLNALLQHVCHPQRVVVMLEIPLPPFCSGYGLVQRRLARRFGAVLIPRRFFANVLTDKQATLDGVHLSQQGHEKMANMVARFISPDFAAAR